MTRIMDILFYQSSTKLFNNLNLTIFTASLLYSLSIIKFSKAVDSFSTIPFTLLLLFITISVSKEKYLKKLKLSDIQLLMASLHVGVLLGFSLSGGHHEELWPIDSLSMHLPTSINISNFLNNKEALRTTYSFFDKIYLTNIWTGILFFLFGISPAITGLSLLLIKMIGVWALFQLTNEVFNKSISKLACLIYITTPTIFFYGISFYREATVQTLILLFFVGVYKQKKNFSIKPLTLTLASLAMISIERFYLFPILAGTYFLFIAFHGKYSKNKRKTIMIVLLVAALAFYKLHEKYFPIDLILQTLQEYRVNLNSYPDINKEFNLNIIYPLAFIKISLTPFFTISKFSMFHNYSYLLIWGSFTNQIIVITAGYSLIKSLKTSVKNHWTLLVPTLFTFALFAYLSPYNGRARDNFYPVLCIWASKYIYKRFNNA